MLMQAAVADCVSAVYHTNDDKEFRKTRGGCFEDHSEVRKLK
jgi:hypothetical protein